MQLLFCVVGKLAVFTDNTNAMLRQTGLTCIMAVMGVVMVLAMFVHEGFGQGQGKRKGLRGMYRHIILMEPGVRFSHKHGNDKITHAYAGIMTKPER